MHKRILCALLAAVLLLSLLPAIALPAGAASNMKTSEACIAILKSMEGFSKYPYFDYEHYSVGYGSTCEEGEYPDGITEEEADKLLREYLADKETSLNWFADRHGILFSQYQFDALMLFTYNCGPSWMIGTGEFRQAVIENATGNDFIYPLTLWSGAGGETLSSLVYRRLREANMYLNGIYDSTLPTSYTYAFYDSNGGESNAMVHGYDSSLEAPVKSRPTRKGHVFLGWYTAAEGGEWVRYLTAAHSQQTIYAHWQISGADLTVGVSADYRVPAAELMNLNTYDAPGGNICGKLDQSEVVQINADSVDAGGVKWGKLSSGQWVKLGDPLGNTDDGGAAENTVKINITGDYVNVRTGPGVDYPPVAAALEGDEIYISRVVDVDGVLWGKCRAGWLCLDYSDYNGGLPVEEPGDDIPYIPGTPEVPGKTQQPEQTAIATGIVETNGLSIRSEVSLSGLPVGHYQKGDKVSLYEITKVAGNTWGRTEKGWISLTYVKMDQEQLTKKEETENPGVSETVPQMEATVPEESIPEKVTDLSRGNPAVVTTKDGLNIRSGPGNSCEIVGSYGSGEMIYLLEQKQNDGILWGRTEDGWICMQYVSADYKWYSQETVSGIATVPEGLTIRSGAGAGHTPVGSYDPGTRIRIHAQLNVAGQRWGCTDRGWISMDGVSLERNQEDASGLPGENSKEDVPGDGQKESETVVGTVTVARLNIRRLPGDTNEIVGYYRSGEEILIREIRYVNGTLWGRTNRGWICLLYVKTEDSGENGQNQTGVVESELLRIRSAPGTGSIIVGTYRLGEQITILEKRRVGTTLWGRTDKGWICMDYVK